MNESTAIIERNPQIIAVEIRGIVGQVRNFALLSSIEIGKRLVEAKEMLSHGEWGEWLEKHVEYSHSQANNLMLLYKEYGEDPTKFPTIANMPMTKALALLPIPAEQREKFAKENEDMSARQLQALIKEKEQLEKRVEVAEKKAEQERKAREADAKKHENMAKDVARLQKELEEAEADFDDEKAAKLQEDLVESQKKIQELEAKLKEKPVDVPAVVEKVPDDVQKELDDLRNKVSGDKAITKFTVCFQSVVNGFDALLGAMGEIEDPDAREKYKNAVSGLLGKMSERLL